VDGVSGVVSNEVLAAGSLGEAGLQGGPPAAHAFRQAFGRAQHDHRHVRQSRGRADLADLRNRRGTQPVLVTEHPDLCSLAEAGRVGVENPGLQLRVVGDTPRERPKCGPDHAPDQAEPVQQQGDMALGR
jgi:hypothetical protein